MVNFFIFFLYLSISNLEKELVNLEYFLKPWRILNENQQTIEECKFLLNILNDWTKQINWKKTYYLRFIYLILKKNG